MREDIEIVDAHHHFWDLNKNYYPFLSDKIDPDIFLGKYKPNTNKSNQKK